MNSLGYHTLSISMTIMEETAGKLLDDFKSYRDSTGKIYIKKLGSFLNDPNADHYEIKYINENGYKGKGIYWHLRFSGDNLRMCSIKAVINPKILVGENCYIEAASFKYLEWIEEAFNTEAAAISPLLKTFYDYKINRIDYCINFDTSRLNDIFPPEYRSKIPEMMMYLIRQGDIPNHYKKEYDNAFQFYLKCDAVVVNCYWKHYDLINNFADCPDLDASYNIIRFEIQYKYPKVYTVQKRVKEEAVLNGCAKSAYDEMRDMDVNTSDDYGIYLREKALRRLMAKEILLNLLSNSKCECELRNYFRMTVRGGDYYSFDEAVKILESKLSGWEKIERLKNHMRLIKNCNGIANVKAVLSDSKKELESFRASLRELEVLGINPITIPDEWGIKQIPGLLKPFYENPDDDGIQSILEREKRKIIDAYAKELEERHNENKVVNTAKTLVNPINEDSLID